jgi:RNA polymerase sigma factor (sigma-70 family)
MVSVQPHLVYAGNGEESEDRSPFDARSVSQENHPAGPLSTAEVEDLVLRIQGGDSTAMEGLYKLFSKGVRFYMCRHLGQQELEDKVHDTFVIVVQAIRRGELRDPGRLMGFVRTVVRRQVAASIDEVVAERKDRTDLDAGVNMAGSGDPEEKILCEENAKLIQRILHRLPERDREIISRFYLDDQPAEQICREMGLSETQFRLIKSRAKTRFTEIGRKKVGKRPFRAFWVRKTLTA